VTSIESILVFALMASPARAAASPQLDRLIVCDDVQDPLTLDPHKEFSEKNHILLQQIYEGLVRFGPQGQIEPALALSWEQRDPVTMRFHLRGNVRFHNGEPFDAEAVKASIERILDPRTKNPAIGFVNSLARVDIVDPLTVDVVTQYPDGILLNRLAWTVPIIPPRYLREVGEEKFAQAPIGTGAFQFVRWEKGERIVLKANSDYWMTGYPKLHELIFRFTPEDKKLAALFNGDIDLVTNIPGTETLQVQSHPGTKIIKSKTFFTAFAGLNISTGPFSDVRVRKAVNLAVDKNSLIRYDLLGNGAIISTLSMPGEIGHDPDIRPYAYDPTKARALLKEAGYGKGFTVLAGGNVNAERTAKIIAVDLAKVGITVKLNLSADSKMLEDFKNHAYGMIFGGVPDPMAHTFFIQSIVLYSKSPYCLSKNPAYDALLEKMITTIDDGKRESLARDLDRYIYDNALDIFTYQRIQTHAARKNLKFTPYVNGFPYFYATEYEKTPTQ